MKCVLNVDAMIYVIIVVAILLVLGPVLWLRPTARERELSQLRQRALQQGLRVQCPAAKQIPWAARNPLVNPHRFARYSLGLDADAVNANRWQEWQGTYYQRADWVPANAGDSTEVQNRQWQWQEARQQSPAAQQLLAELEKAPLATVIALECRAQEVAIYWDETGGTTMLNAIGQFMQRLKVYLESVG